MISAIKRKSRGQRRLLPKIQVIKYRCFFFFKLNFLEAKIKLYNIKKLS